MLDVKRCPNNLWTKKAKRATQAEKNSLCKKVPRCITMRKQTLLDPDLTVGLMSEHPSQGLG